MRNSFKHEKGNRLRFVELLHDIHTHKLIRMDVGYVKADDQIADQKTLP